ncbi:hypothetical protein EYF80_026508 [Liparis tanakae]|uniref:Uncharacterized protein n=1 Tax=Liparis tanakae TaxID=230148 RepID=A0A4Z2HBJ2_9TELE|nr:hypothetical protein EYF80_026508 [Liparis tanakae]
MVPTLVVQVPSGRLAAVPRLPVPCRPLSAAALDQERRGALAGSSMGSVLLRGGMAAAPSHPA